MSQKTVPVCIALAIRAQSGVPQRLGRLSESSESTLKRRASVIPGCLACDRKAMLWGFTWAQGALGTVSLSAFLELESNRRPLETTPCQLLLHKAAREFFNTFAPNTIVIVLFLFSPLGFCACIARPTFHFRLLMHGKQHTPWRRSHCALVSALG